LGAFVEPGYFSVFHMPNTIGILVDSDVMGDDQYAALDIKNPLPDKHHDHLVC